MLRGASVLKNVAALVVFSMFEPYKKEGYNTQIDALYKVILFAYVVGIVCGVISSLIAYARPRQL